MRLALAVVALLLALPGVASAACPQAASCGRVTVPLDHSGATPGSVSLAYARLPARAARTGTLAILSGGPGQSSIPLARDIGRLLEHYDILAVDARGTGSSGAVACDVASVAACAERLGAARAHWTTAETAEDLEDVRVALGIGPLALLGVSYGTKVAGEFARRHPASTAALVLDSPVAAGPLDGVNRLRSLGLPRMLREVCSPVVCRRTVRDPNAALAAALKRLPLRGTQVSGTGDVRRARVRAGDLYLALVLSDLLPALRAGLPAAIASLAEGDAAPLLHLAATGGDDDLAGGINVARLLATSCVESQLPWAPESDPATRAGALAAFSAEHARDYAPFDAATALAASSASLCRDWPATPAPPAPAGPAPDVPVLVLSGRADLRTPLEQARVVAAEYRRARVLAVPGVGHSVLGSDFSGCAARGVVAFLGGRPVRVCRAAATDPQRLSAPYVPADLSGLRPTRLPGRAGRTLSAVRITLTAIRFDVATSGRASGRAGGLRAGSYAFTPRTLRLRSLEWIRGVRLSGRLDAGGSGTLTVRGGVRGTIRISGDRMRGTLGGRAFSLG